MSEKLQNEIVCFIIEKLFIGDGINEK